MNTYPMNRTKSNWKYFFFFFIVCIIFVACGNDDESEINCEHGNVIAKIDEQEFNIEHVGVASSSSNVGVLHKRAIAITLQDDKGQTLIITFSSLVENDEDKCPLVKEYHEARSNSFCIVSSCDGIIGEYSSDNIIFHSSDQTNGTGTGTITVCDSENQTFSGSFSVFIHANFNQVLHVTGSFDDLCF